MIMGGPRIRIDDQSAQMVKILPAMQETWVQSLGQEDPLEKEMENYSSFLAWKIPWTEEPGRLYSPWDCKELDKTERLMEKAIAPHCSTLTWRIPWMEEPGRLQSMGSLSVGHD